MYITNLLNMNKNQLKNSKDYRKNIMLIIDLKIAKLFNTIYTVVNTKAVSSSVFRSHQPSSGAGDGFANIYGKYI